VSKACNKKGVLEDYEIRDENGQLVLLLSQTMDCFANRTIILTLKPKADELTDESKLEKWERESVDHVSNFSDLREEQRRRKETLRNPPKFANTGKHRQEAAERRRTLQLLDNYDPAADVEYGTEETGTESEERSSHGILHENPEFSSGNNIPDQSEIIPLSRNSTEGSRRIRGSRRRGSFPKKSTEKLAPPPDIFNNNNPQIEILHRESGDIPNLISKSISEPGMEIQKLISKSSSESGIGIPYLFSKSSSEPGMEIQKLISKSSSESGNEIPYLISKFGSEVTVTSEISEIIIAHGKSELEEITNAPPNEESEQSSMDSEEVSGGRSVPLSLPVEKINCMYNEKRSSIQAVFDLYRMEIREMNDLVDKVQQEAYAELKNKRELALEDITKNVSGAPPQDWLPTNNYLKKVALLKETINLVKVQISNFNDNSK